MMMKDDACFYNFNIQRKLLLLVLLCLSGNVLFAQENNEVIDGLNYQLDASTLQAVLLPNVGSEYSGDIVIPETVTATDGKNYTVVGLGDECFQYSHVKAVKIPQTVTYLGKYSIGFSDIESIIIPSSVTIIGDDCFSGCDNLETVIFKGELPDNALNCGAPRICALFVPSAALDSYQKELKSTYQYIYAWDIGDAETESDAPVWFETIQNIRYLINKNSQSAAVMPYKDGDSLLNWGDVVIPSEIVARDGQSYKVTALNDNCFSACAYLSSIVIPNTVTSLGKRCFMATSLSSITIPNSVTSIGEDCFLDCYKLKDVVLPPFLKSIGENCFWICSELEKLAIPASITTLPKNCFGYCTKLKEIVIPASVTEIGYGCFSFCI